MLLDEPGNNVTLASFHVRRLLQMYSANALDLMDRFLEPLLPNGFQHAYFPPNAANLSYAYIGDRSRKIVYIRGVSNLNHVTNVVAGYAEASAPLGYSGRNPFYFNMAETIYNYIMLPQFDRPEHIDIVGHSAGGATGIVLKLLLLRRNPTIKCKVVTFGAPRAMSIRDSRELGNSPIVRWFTPGDPIPLVPPRVDEMPSLLLTAPTLLLLRYGSYTHLRGGIEVDVNGNCTSAVLPSLATMSATTSLLNWWFGISQEPVGQHSLSTYDEYLTRALQVYSTPSVQTRDTGARELPSTSTRRHLTQAESVIVNATNEQGHLQQVPPLVVPKAQLFQATKLGKVWTVTFAGQVVFVAPIERRARSIARSGNALLKKMPRQAVVNPQAIVDGLTEYFNAATNPASGFSPQINLNVPGV